MCSRTWRAWDSRWRGALVVVGRLARIEVGSERHLGVDDHVLAAGQPHLHVRPQAAIVGRCRDLLLEIAVREHAGELHDALQLDLAPAAADVRRRAARSRGDAVRSLNCASCSPQGPLRALARELERPHLTRRPS